MAWPSPASHRSQDTLTRARCRLSPASRSGWARCTRRCCTPRRTRKHVTAKGKKGDAEEAIAAGPLRRGHGANRPRRVSVARARTCLSIAATSCATTTFPYAASANCLRCAAVKATRLSSLGQSRSVCGCSNRPPTAACTKLQRSETKQLNHLACPPSDCPSEPFSHRRRTL